MSTEYIEYISEDKVYLIICEYTRKRGISEYIMFIKAYIVLFLYDLLLNRIVSLKIG